MLDWLKSMASRTLFRPPHERVASRRKKAPQDCTKLPCPRAPARRSASMTTLRRMTTDDLFKFNNINLDVLTETVGDCRARCPRSRAAGEPWAWAGRRRARCSLVRPVPA